MNLVRRSFFLLYLMGIISSISCTDNSAVNVQEKTSKVYGVNSPSSPRLLTAEESDKIFRRLTQKSAQWSAKGQVYLDQQLENFVIEETIAYKGILGDDWVRILSRLVEDRQNSCGCTPCKSVLNLDRQRINIVLDGIFSNTEKNASFAGLNSNSSILIKNLVRDIEVSEIDNDTGLDGTCALPTPKAFALRNQRVVVPTRAQSLVPLKVRSIDYRKDIPLHFQGSTGACHMFSLKSMFDFSDRYMVKEIDDVDLFRNFIDVWTDNLGGSLEVALHREVEYLKELSIDKSQYIDIAKTKGLLKFEAEEKWMNSLKTRLRKYGHGSDVLRDFIRMKHRGYIRSGVVAEGPPVSRKSLESISLDLANKRFSLFKRYVEKSTTPEEIMKELRPDLANLFAIRMINNTLRRPASEDFKTLTMEVVTFDQNHLEQSENLFFEHLANHGPIGVSRKSHATTVVAYEAKSGVFYLTDSSVGINDYIKVSYQDFFSYLDRYYFIKPTSDSQ